MADMHVLKTSSIVLLLLWPFYLHGCSGILRQGGMNTHAHPSRTLWARHALDVCACDLLTGCMRALFALSDPTALWPLFRATLHTLLTSSGVGGCRGLPQ